MSWQSSCGELSCADLLLGDIASRAGPKKFGRRWLGWHCCTKGILTQRGIWRGIKPVVLYPLVDLLTYISYAVEPTEAAVGTTVRFRRAAALLVRTALGAVDFHRRAQIRAGLNGSAACGHVADAAGRP